MARPQNHVAADAIKQGKMTANGGGPQVAPFRERKDTNANAARLRKRGFSVACLPAIEIRTKPVRPRRARHDAAVATSDKAGRAA